MRLIENKMLQINRYKKVGAHNIYISYRFKSAEAETLLKPQCFAADSSATKHKHQSFAVMRRTGCLFFIVSLISLLFVQSSCINDTSFGAQDGVVNVPLSFALSKAASSTRALDETQVNDFTVLVFNSSGSLVGSNYSSVSGTSSSVNVSSTQGSGYTICGIANTGSSTYFSSVSNLSDFKKMATASLSPTSSLSSGSSLMMFGQLTNVTIGATGIMSSSNTTSVNTISLSRVCSKFNFTITPASGITITGYQLCNLPSNSYIYDGNGSSNPSTTFYNYVVSCSSSTTVTTDPYYMYENLAGTNSASTSEALRISSNVPTGTTASYLKVTAQKAGSWHSVYYIYLGGLDALGATDYTDYNVRRNCNYTCTVNINGPGKNDARVTYTSDVPVATYLYSDGTWGTSIPSPTDNLHIIGVVFSTTTSANDQAKGWTHGYAMAVTNAQNTGSVQWSTYQVKEMSGLYIKTAALMEADLDGYTNSQTIKTKAGSNIQSQYPVFYYALNYGTASVGGIKYAAPSGTSGWYLPSIGQWYLIVKNLGSMATAPIYTSNGYGSWVSPAAYNAAAAINTSLSNVTSSDLIDNTSSDGRGFFSSSEWSSSITCTMNFSNDGILIFDTYSKTYRHGTNVRVRSVIAF